MDEQTQKILKMIEEGFLTAEQGSRLIEELGSSPRKQESPPQTPDLMKMAEEAGKTFAQGLESLFGAASQTVKDGLGLGPQNIILKVLDAEGMVERYHITVPYKIFTALKPLLTQKPAVVMHPFQNIDYAALFEVLEAGETGRVFEYVDHARGDRLEVWVE